ncbi:hypothetical protein ONE63_007211 [Megalurothrips usitatus]|uniref:Carotenoid isomerooxygenase n=1 Tax=Megalurothrips usitatus TaxID=439358 RepID=A0AAV7XS28_9NEOP|nr:hypothetical protein ONE63_007211 [Megalurothrips usitatus]
MSTMFSAPRRLEAPGGSAGGSRAEGAGRSAEGEARRRAYETAEKAAGREVDQAVASRLEAGQDLYPNCHVHIWLRSCREEVTQPLAGTTTGSFPKWVRGTLLRNGPGSLDCGRDKFQHLFDGAALLQRFGIADGEVTYQCRFLRSQTWRRNAAAKRIVVTEFGTRAAPDPCQTIFKRVAAMFRPGEAMSDNAMISVYPVGDEFYAFTESPVMTRVDPVTLQTLQRVNVASSLGIVNHTSHPLVQEDGSVVNLGMSLSATGPQYSLIHFPAPQPGDPAMAPVEGGRLHGGVAARWPLHPGYMHSFGATASYFVLVEQPLSVSVPAMVRGQLSGDPFAASLRWFPEYPTLIHLVCRSTGRRTHTFEAESFFFLHVINCFERPSLAAEDSPDSPGEVVVDICCYKDPAMISCMYIDALREAQRNPDYARLFRGRPLRFVLPLAGSGARVQPRPLCDLGCETPRLNPANVSKPYRYFYAISSDVDADNPGTLIKVDTWTEKCFTWGELGVYPSEPIFVPSPDGQNEDDGVLLCALVWGDDDQRAGLLAVDAATMQELGRAVFNAPSQVPKCLHGWFAPSIV